MKHENLKFRIKDKKHSEEVQKLLFKLGYRWSGTTEIKHLGHEHIYANVSTALTNGGTTAYFLKHENKEVGIQYLKMKLGLGTIGLDYEIY